VAKQFPDSNSIRIVVVGGIVVAAAAIVVIICRFLDIFVEDCVFFQDSFSVREIV
jgi:hypothetical protein